MDNAEHIRERREMGLRLVGNRVKFHHQPPGAGVACLKVEENGMVAIEGWEGSLIHPEVLEIDGEVTAVPCVGVVH